MKAELILKSKNIFTGNSDVLQSGGVAIKGNKILSVGPEAEKYRDGNTKVLELGDKLIMPGFVDAHTHYFMAAVSSSKYMCMEIAKSTSEQECIDMIREFANAHPEYDRIRGMGWFPANWDDAPLPTKESLDAVFPDKPVYLLAADAHTMWLNTKALEESGITKATTIVSGHIGKTENGELNGLLFELEAYKPALHNMMEFDDTVLMTIYEGFNKKINACGITAVSEMSADEYDKISAHNYEMIRQMEQKHRMTCRLHLFTKLDGYTDFSEALKLKASYCSEKLRLSGVKGFIDGVTSTYTGLLLEPYTDRPDTCGEGAPLNSTENNEKFVIAANKAGLPVRLHCIGDGAVRIALDLFEESRKANGDHGLANTIEHIETIDPADIPRLAQLDVIPSMQPYHLTLDANEKLRRVGDKRCRWEWPHKTILENGGQLAFGTDYPVVDFNPFANIYSAVTRCDDKGKPTGVNPEESLELVDVLKAYTQGASRAYSREDIGVLEEGKLADIAVIDCNLFDISPLEIPEASVEITVMDGKIVYQKPGVK